MLYPHICLGVMPFDGAYMGRYAFITLFSVLGLFSPGMGMAEELFIEKVEALSGKALPEVREFIIRKLGCDRWESKSTQGNLKDDDTRRAMRHLRCDSLAAEEDFLRKTYARHAASMSALNAARGMQASTAGPSLEPVTSAIGF
jgi:hypothetical protein